MEATFTRMSLRRRTVIWEAQREVAVSKSRTGKVTIQVNRR